MTKIDKWLEAYLKENNITIAEWDAQNHENNKHLIRYRRAHKKNSKIRETMFEAEFDQYIGSQKIKEMGLWDENNPSSTIPGTVSVVKDRNHDEHLVIKCEGFEFELSARVDQWGTYYSNNKAGTIAACEGTRSFFDAIKKGIKTFEKRTGFKQKKATITKKDE